MKCMEYAIVYYERVQHMKNNTLVLKPEHSEHQQNNISHTFQDTQFRVF